ncbi:hypothetical protein LINPERPRIM_LOCUS24848 [Linum perenne]
MRDIATCKQYLGIVNMVGKEALMLDSSPANDDSARKNCTRQLLSTLDKIIRHETFGTGQDVDIPLLKEFEVTTYPVVAQNNGTECGVHLMQYMRYRPTNIRYIAMKMHGLDARKEISQWLLLHPSNKKRHDNVMGAQAVLHANPEYQAQRRKDIRAIKALTKQVKASLHRVQIPKL